MSFSKPSRTQNTELGLLFQPSFWPRRRGKRSVRWWPLLLIGVISLWPLLLLFYFYFSYIFRMFQTHLDNTEKPTQDEVGWFPDPLSSYLFRSPSMLILSLPLATLKVPLPKWANLGILSPSRDSVWKLYVIRDLSLINQIRRRICSN